MLFLFGKQYRLFQPKTSKIDANLVLLFESVYNAIDTPGCTPVRIFIMNTE